jgi:hypothetical protein
MADGIALVDYSNKIQFNSEFSRLFKIKSNKDAWVKMKMTTSVGGETRTNLTEDI